MTLDPFGIESTGRWTRLPRRGGALPHTGHPGPGACQKSAVAAGIAIALGAKVECSETFSKK